jgi:hypothetical protein
MQAEDKVTGKRWEQVDIVHGTAPQPRPGHPARFRWLTGRLDEQGLWHWYHIRGRVFGALNTTAALVGLASVGLAGIFGDLLGIVPMLSVAGGITLLAGAIALVILPKGKAHSELAAASRLKRDSASRPMRA